MSLKISLPGFDVKTATPEQLAIDSSYDTLKLIMDPTSPYYGELFVTFQDNPPAGTYNILKYKHKFNYVPFYYFFFDSSKSSKLLSADFGTVFANDVSNKQIFQVTDTVDGFSFDYIVTDNSGFNMNTNYFSFRYFVYVNDGA